MRYSINGRVRYSETGENREITLPGIINYFQDCSTFQSEDIGLGTETLKTQKKVWVLSYWQVVARRYPKMGEEITVSTWATGFKGLFATRNFLMEDSEGKPAAYANSVWVLLDMETGRPIRPGEEDIQGYGVEEPFDMEYTPRKIMIPKETKILDSFPVRKYHMDTNHHVNNCQYVQMALEILEEMTGESVRVGQVRVDYKKSAVYGDIILPKIAFEAERTVVELCDMEENPYVVVEFCLTDKN